MCPFFVSQSSPPRLWSSLLAKMRADARFLELPTVLFVADPHTASSECFEPSQALRVRGLAHCVDCMRTKEQDGISSNHRTTCGKVRDRPKCFGSKATMLCCKIRLRSAKLSRTLYLGIPKTEPCHSRRSIPWADKQSIWWQGCNWPQLCLS